MLVTTRIRRMEKIMFSVCLSVHQEGEGYPSLWSKVLSGGLMVWEVPHSLVPGSIPGGAPDQDKGTPSQDRGTTPTQDTGSPSPLPHRIRMVVRCKRYAYCVHAGGLSCFRFSWFALVHNDLFWHFGFNFFIKIIKVLNSQQHHMNDGKGKLGFLFSAPVLDFW